METFDKILASLIGLAILSIIVSKKAQTGGVIQSFAAGISSIMAAVVAPITGTATASAAAGQASGGGGGGGGSNIGNDIASSIISSVIGSPFSGSIPSPGAGW